MQNRTSLLTINNRPIHLNGDLLPSEAKSRAEFIQAVNLERSMLSTQSLYFIQVPDIKDCPLIDYRWDEIEENLHSDYPTVGKHTVLRNADVHVDLKIYLTGFETKAAAQHYVALGSSHAIPSPIFESGPAFLGENSGRYHAADYARYIWLFRNVVVDLKVNGLDPEYVQEIAIWLHNEILTYTAILGEKAYSNMRISPRRQEIEVGGMTTINVECPADAELFVEDDYRDLLIVEEKYRSFTFKGRQPGNNSFRITAVDPNTLLSTTHEVSIVVNENNEMSTSARNI